MAWFEVLRGGVHAICVPLDASELRVGSGYDSDVPLPDPSTPARAFRILRSEIGFLVDPLAPGAVRINGAGATAHALEDGDTIDVGAWRFVFRRGSVRASS
jgi:predicted component of type VI protein secretion system